MVTHISDFEGAREKVIKWYAENVSLQEIADRICMEYNTQVTKKQVWDELQKSKRKIGQVIQQDEGFSTRLAEQFLLTTTQLNELNQNMWQIFYDCKNEKVTKEAVCLKCGSKVKISTTDYSNMVKIANHLMEQISQVQKVLQKMKGQSLMVQHDVTSMTKNLTKILPELLDNLEKRGIAKINHKRLKQIYQ